MVGPGAGPFNPPAALAGTYATSLPADGHRAARAREPEEVLGAAAARPAGPDLPRLPGEGAAAPGRVRPPVGRGAGTVGGGRGLRPAAAGRQLAVGGEHGEGLPRRA